MNKEALLTIVEEIVTLQSKVNKDMSEALGIVETEVHTFGSTREEQSKIPNIINSLFEQRTNTRRDQRKSINPIKISSWQRNKEIRLNIPH